MSYNENSAKKYNWFPEWFDCFDFGEELTDSISRFQKRIGLKPDGLCGPVTIKAKYSERMKQIPIGNNLIFGGNLIPIEWDKVVSFVDFPSWKANHIGDRIGQPKRDIKLFVNHWDAALSSRDCHSILERRGLSCHLYINNDGTIINTCDLQNVTYHAGGRRWNETSIGVEISNAYYLRYQSKYESKGFGTRPIVRSQVHGKQLPPHLGFYPVQLEALKKLFDAVHGLGIPKQTPQVETIYEPAQNGEYSGFIHHFHLSKNKIDCSGALNISDLF
tara:strand:+ start:5664 stop:6488 length:825 start_codon:yes stop_codon:yes gene_type:complete